MVDLSHIREGNAMRRTHSHLQLAMPLFVNFIKQTGNHSLISLFMFIIPYISHPRNLLAKFRFVHEVFIVFAFLKLHLMVGRHFASSTSLEAPSVLITSQAIKFLDKAAILQDGMAPEPWKVCTVTQVEEVKILTRMLPIIASTIIMNTCLAQLQTFSVLQGYFMDAHLGSIEIPTASIPVIPLLFMSILIPIYEFLVIPLARKITGHPSGITQLQRVGVGLVLSIISMSIAGVIEVKRRDHAAKFPPEKISLFWLSFQYGVFGIADMFAMVGLMEFLYKESPSGMRSLSTSFALLSLSFGYFLSSAFVSIVNAITKNVTSNKQGWLEAPDLNHNKLELFYWFLAILSCLNFANYLFWASWYKYKSDAKENENEVKAVNGEVKN